MPGQSRKGLPAAVLAALLLAAAPAGAASHGRAVGVPRDSYGRIARSESAKHAFLKDHPCPAGQKCVVDHIRPLACGGLDAASNMQLQTVEAAKAKDRWELDGPGCPPRK